nr:hypothetical protein [Tanacetum cinerariifolium]
TFSDSKIDDDISVYDDDFEDINECKVALEDKRECTVPISKNFPDCDNHSDTFSDSKIDDDISVYDDDFEDIKYVEASLLGLEIVSIEEENGIEEENFFQREEEEVEDISQVQDIVLREKLLSITRLISNIESLNDNSTPNQPPDDNFDLEPEVILVVMEDIDEPDEHFNPGGEIFVSTNNKDADYIPFIVEEKNDVNQEEEEFDLEDIFQIQDIDLREKLLSITRLISNIESLNDNPTPDRVLNSFEFDNSFLDNFSPEFETFCDHTEETRS